MTLSAIGCSGEDNSLVTGFKQVTTDLTMTGEGRGTVRRTDPSPESCVKDGGDEEACRWSFSDAGGGGSFVLEAEPDVGSVFGSWSACSSTSGTSCVLEFGSGAADTTFTPRATFNLEGAIENSCPDIEVPPLGSLGLKAGPRPANATPVPDNPAAWAGTNYLADPGFEQQLVFQGGIPTGTGYWAFDQAWSAPSGQQGITAQAGSRMLHFVSSSRDGTQSDVGTASEQIQLVDVSALRTRIDAGQVAVQARAFFNRVAAGGCTRIDNAFGIRVSAHAGIPTDVNVDLGFAQENVTADDDPGTWQSGLVLLTLPTGTTHVAVRIFINEGAANNDAAYPEFHGHYADGATLSVQEVL
jgi:hypothetical protein